MSAESPSTCESFLSHLANLDQALSITLRCVQEGRGQFLSAGGDYLCRLEQSFLRIRVVTQQLEKEFNLLEYLLADRLARNKSDQKNSV